jgi:polysaccharide pyruvyl transferase CsaB
MGPRSILIIGNYGAGNLGDDAILSGILTDLKAIGYRGKIAVTHGGDESSHDLYKGLQKVTFVPAGIRSRFSLRRKEAFEAIRHADLVILGGGGLFVDTESKKAPWIWAAQAHACRHLRTRYICYGQSVGPLKTWAGRFLAKWTFRHAKAIHVRDESSQKLLKSWGIESTCGSDAALSWLQQERKKVEKQPVILVALRFWPGIDTATWNQLLKPIQEFAKKKKWKPILISMDARNEEERCALRGTGLEVFEPTSATMAFEAFQKSQLAITMRLHAGLFALAAGLPILALSYSTKVAALFESLHANGSVEVLEPTKWTPKTLQKHLEKLKTPSRFDAETPVMRNQAFLAHELDLH